MSGVTISSHLVLFLYVCLAVFSTSYAEVAAVAVLLLAHGYLFIYGLIVTIAFVL